MKRILIYGFYFKNNIGDDFFKESFLHLFSEFELIFTDYIDSNNLENIDAVFIGGGSFLSNIPNITTDAFQILKNKKVFYLGIGIEQDMHPIHLELFKTAKLILTRSLDQIDYLKNININSFFAPDLAYALQHKVNRVIKNNSILILPNSYLIPNNKDPHWKYASWDYFKSEFSQFLDWLLENKYELNFFSLCQSDEMHDTWAANELIGQMSYRRNSRISISQAKNMEDVSKLVSKHKVVITQRFHGIVLSEMTKTPYMAIYHHDKLKNCYPANGKFVSYYGLNKNNLIQNFNETINMKFNSSLPIETDTYEAFSNQVKELI